MEHIQEIRSLRKRLEESIKTNEKLRKRLERQGAECDHGKADVLKGWEGFVCDAFAWVSALCIRTGLDLAARETSVQILTLLLT